MCEPLGDVKLGLRGELIRTMRCRPTILCNLVKIASMCKTSAYTIREQAFTAHEILHAMRGLKATKGNDKAIEMLRKEGVLIEKED